VLQPEELASRIKGWTPLSGPVVHPHPAMAKLFTHVQVVPNYFGVRVGDDLDLPVGTVYRDGRVDHDTEPLAMLTDELE
jgi:hypothetical protein